MATTMQSVMENADKNRQYAFYVLHQEITNVNMNLLKNQISLFPQFSIEFIDVNERIGKYNLYLSRHITIETYFRLLIPELLSEHQKAIYLDGDMICCGNIAELFDIDLNGYLLAAVRDGLISWYYSKKNLESFKHFGEILLKLKNPEEYFNGGMLVFNLELFRETISTDKLLKLAASRKWPLHDQDILNYLAEGKTLFLPYHWNFIPNKHAKYLPEYLLDEYNSAEKNPKFIIHFISLKPWDQEIFFLHYELFWKYATRTPFLETIIERMKSRGLISNETFSERIISNITHRKGIGIHFILIDCLKAWLHRDKR
jgi:lipopolysaccharide biosynthesis glycosyltransferase